MLQRCKSAVLFGSLGVPISPQKLTLMKALMRTEQGVSLENIPVPTPKPGEVLVRVMCSGLCRTDLYIAEGLLNSQRPVVLGHEGAGVIYRLGEGVDPHRMGERVALLPWIGCGSCSFCRNDSDGLQHLCPERQFLGRHLHGCFAEFLCIRADRCLPLPEELSFQEGAFLEPVTAALGVLRAPLKKAGSVAILGDNRIASLTSLLLSEYADVEHRTLSSEEIPENAFNLVIETEATEESLERAIRCLKPDGLLVLKSRPPAPVAWPVRLQVEKEISTMAVSYGSLRLALLLLRKKREVFASLWNAPEPLDTWFEAFERAKAGEESKKVFFLPSSSE